MEPDSRTNKGEETEPQDDDVELGLDDEQDARESEDPQEREKRLEEKRRLKEERKKKMEEEKKNKRKQKKELKTVQAEAVPTKKAAGKVAATANNIPSQPVPPLEQPEEEDMDAPKPSAVQRVQKVKTYESHTLFLVDGTEVLVENNKIEKWEADRRQRELEIEELEYEREQREKLKQQTRSELEKLQQNLELKRAMKNKKGKKH